MTKPSHTLEQTTSAFFAEHVVFESAPAVVRKLLLKFVQTPPSFMVVDTETTGLDPWAGQTYYHSKVHEEVRVVQGAKVFSVQVGLFDDKREKLYCLYIDVEDTLTLKLAQKLLANSKILKVLHNCKFDRQLCHVSGITFKGPWWDTLAATRLTHDRLPQHDLKYLGNYFSGAHSCNADDRWEKDVKDWLRRAKNTHTRAGYSKEYINYSVVPNELMIPYALKDIWYTYLLYMLSKPEIEANYSTVFHMEMRVIDLLTKMEREGAYIDRSAARKAVQHLNRYIKVMHDQVKIAAAEVGVYNFNPASPAQLMKAVLAYGVHPQDLINDKKKVSCDAKVLQRITEKYPKFTLAQLVVAYRTAAKLKSTYFQTLLDKSASGRYGIRGTVHCQLKPSDTATGRAACTDPNLQNIPRPTSAQLRAVGNGSKRVLSILSKPVPTVRSVFVPRPGYVNLYFDYSQVEMRIFALFCQEQEMLKGLEQGLDFHESTGRLMYGPKFETNPKLFRQMAKGLNFGIIFGMGIARLAAVLGCTLAKAKELKAEYFRRFPNINRLLMRSKQQLISDGYVEDMFGRRYHIPMDCSYIAVNSLVQGGAANVLKTATLQVDDYLTLRNIDAHVLLPIHDELLIQMRADDVPTVAPVLKLLMEEVLAVKQYGVATTVEVQWTDTTWEQKHSLEFTPEQMRHATHEFSGVYDEVVVRYDIPQVTWFLS